MFESDLHCVLGKHMLLSQGIRYNISTKNVMHLLLALHLFGENTACMLLQVIIASRQVLQCGKDCGYLSPQRHAYGS